MEKSCPGWKDQLPTTATLGVPIFHTIFLQNVANRLHT